MPGPPRLSYNTYYHIYNRGNNRENIFFEERNYPYFLKLYFKHISPIAETFAYCLLKNHFHFALRIKSMKQVVEAYQSLKSFQFFSPSHAFSNFFNAYAKSINKAYGRTGSLVQHPFQRKPIRHSGYLQRLIVYIHQNPQKHGFVEDFWEWPYSSYQSFLQESDDYLARDAIIDLFGETNNFRESHIQPVEIRGLKNP